MNTQLIKDGLIWGVLLWLVGYLLGFVFFAFVPASLIGWAIMPVGIVVTVFVLVKFIKGTSLSYYLWLGVIWMLVAVALDYLLLVQLLHPADGYYKLDVYLYYGLTLILPLIVFLGWKKRGLPATTPR